MNTGTPIHWRPNSSSVQTACGRDWRETTTTHLRTLVTCAHCLRAIEEERTVSA